VANEITDHAASALIVTLTRTLRCAFWTAALLGRLELPVSRLARTQLYTHRPARKIETGKRGAQIYRSCARHSFAIARGWASALLLIRRSGRRIDPASTQNPDDGFTRFYETSRGIAHAGDPRRLYRRRVRQSQSSVRLSIDLSRHDGRNTRGLAAPPSPPPQVPSNSPSFLLPPPHRWGRGRPLAASLRRKQAAFSLIILVDACCARCAFFRVFFPTWTFRRSRRRGSATRASSNHFASAQPTHPDHQGKLRTCV